MKVGLRNSLFFFVLVIVSSSSSAVVNPVAGQPLWGITARIGTTVDAIDFEVNNVSEGWGIAISQEDLSATGTTISDPGRYYLSSNLLFSPAAASSTITIDADNVHLDMQGRTIAQGNATASVNGILIKSGHKNITVRTPGNVGAGVIQNFTGTGVTVESGCECLALSNMAVKNSGSHGIEVATGGYILIFLDIIAANNGGDGINLTGGNEALFRNSLLSNNTGSGLAVSDTNRLQIIGTWANQNTVNGIAVSSTSTNVESYIAWARLFENTNHGLVVSDTNNAMIHDCTIKKNGGDGMRLTDCVDVEILNNSLTSNTGDGIRLNDVSGGCSDCYVARNQMTANGGINLDETSGSGPNSILGNFAKNPTLARNYCQGMSFITTVTIEQTAGFVVSPGKWDNINMITSA